MNGHAIAGGLVLVLACDYRLGVDGDYRVGLNEVAVGASFPRVALEIVRLRLPHARAAELMLGAALYPASQALRLGVVDELLAGRHVQGHGAAARRAAGRLPARGVRAHQGRAGRRCARADRRGDAGGGGRAWRSGPPPRAAPRAPASASDSASALTGAAPSCWRSQRLRGSPPA